MRRSWLFRILASFLVAGVVTGLAWAGLTFGVFQAAQLRVADALFPVIEPHPKIAIVALDDATFQELGVFPLPRRYHAALIRSLDEAGAEVIGYDITFTEATDSADDQQLETAISEAGNVVLGAQATLEDELGEVPIAETVDLPLTRFLDEAAGAGHVNIYPDLDGVTRAFPPVIESPNRQFLPALAVQLFGASEALAGPVTLRPDGVQVGDELIPTGPGHLLDINYSHPFDAQTYSLVDVIRGRVPDEAFRDKIVLVGGTALTLGDIRPTPLDKQTGEPGVLVHAHALNTLLQRAYIEQTSLPVTLAIVFALALFVANAVEFARVWLSAILAAGAATGYVLLAFWRFDEEQVSLNIVYPILAGILAYIAALGVRYFTEVRERRRVTRVFGRYVAEDVVDEVLAAPERALATLEGAERPISILFADLRGFTAASEGAAPKEVVAALNLYLDAMTRAVNEERGTIDKFMGDCVMAFWGAPRPVFDHAVKAVRSAVRMLDYIDEARDRAEAGGFKVKGCGVGVATGVAVVGNIGSAERLDYTVIGDTVNTASRLCGVAGAGEVVVTEECAASLREEFRLSPLPPLMVKGKTETLTVFQVLREGQEAKRFAEGATIDSTEEKGHFEGEGEAEEEMQVAPARAASYAPVEPVDDSLQRDRKQ